MNTETNARQIARKRAKSTGEERYVVFSPGELGIPGNDYHVCSLEDVDTFYLGCRVIAVYGPGGEEDKR